MFRWRGGTLTHWSMSAQVWHEGVRLFGFWKPEDSVMDPHDLHLRENNRLRALSNPLLLNEALLMRRRGAFKECEQNCDEVLENDPGLAKAWFRRGQARIDLQKWEDARHDFMKAVECGAVQGEVDKELNRLRKLERQQDAKDGKTLKHTFDDDRPSIYDTATSKGVEKALRDIKEDALRRKARGPSLREPVSKKSRRATTTGRRPIPNSGRRTHRLATIGTRLWWLRTSRRRSRTSPTRRRRRGGKRSRTTTTRRSRSGTCGSNCRRPGRRLNCDFCIVYLSS